MKIYSNWSSFQFLVSNKSKSFIKILFLLTKKTHFSQKNTYKSVQSGLKNLF